MNLARGVLLLSVVACSCDTDRDRDPSSLPAPVSSRGVSRKAKLEQPPAPTPVARAPSATPEAKAPPVEWPEERPKAAPEAERTPEAKVERDYPAELLAALGDPSGCVKPRPVDAPGSREASVQVEAYVVGAGNVSRSYVQSSQLDPEESECIRRRVGALRFKTPIDEAPRAVRASLKLQFQQVAKPAH